MSGTIVVEDDPDMFSSLVWYRSSTAHNAILDRLIEATAVNSPKLSNWLSKGKTDSEFAYEFFGSLDTAQLSEEDLRAFLKATEDASSLLFQDLWEDSKDETIKRYITSLALLRVLFWNHHKFQGLYGNLKTIMCDKSRLEIPEWAFKASFEIMSAHLWQLSPLVSKKLLDYSIRLDEDLLNLFQGLDEKTRLAVSNLLLDVSTYVCKLNVRSYRTMLICSQVISVITFLRGFCFVPPRS